MDAVIVVEIICSCVVYVTIAIMLTIIALRG